MAKPKYKTEYCARVVDYFSRFLDMRDDPDDSDAAERGGMVPVIIDNGQPRQQNKPCSGYPSMVKFAKILGVTPRTLRNWRDKYKDFDEACEFADEIQDEVLNERALSQQVDGRVAMKIRELKANARKLEDDGAGRKITLVIESDGEADIPLQKWTGEVNEDTDYKV